nr:Fic family protein [uncultured Anaerostipes sp.]
MSNGKYCYPDSDVLINKYQIHDRQLLEKLEIQKVAIKLLGLDVHPQRIEATLDIAHLTSVHKYLFGGLYDWASTFRDENLYKSERVLSGGSAEYTDYHDIERKLNTLFHKFKTFNWREADSLEIVVSDFLLELWSIHPFREGNTRTCITFLWHYLGSQKINFRVELLRNTPMYVRDSLVMANYDQKNYLQKIIADALIDPFSGKIYQQEESTQEQYQIAQSDYEAFREKYSVKK